MGSLGEGWMLDFLSLKNSRLQLKGSAPFPTRKIVLVAHDGCKTRLSDWVIKNKTKISQHQLYATATTGSLLESCLNIPIIKFKSGPMGGDQQVGSRIVENKVDFLIFFWDPLSMQPHSDDVKALLRLATLYNIPTACNEATADLLVTSLFSDWNVPRIDQSLSNFTGEDNSSYRNNDSSSAR